MLVRLNIVRTSEEKQFSITTMLDNMKSIAGYLSSEEVIVDKYTMYLVLVSITLHYACCKQLKQGLKNKLLSGKKEMFSNRAIPRNAGIGKQQYESQNAD
ncbi:hypothetical protein M8J76_007526 [Diaphorina citri]|nr:hypothetical protein M8J75_012337 [Diaphorina citri]KAI5736824.1 hypothetical protein M8J76_007526 [Diaphorina citri]